MSAQTIGATVGETYPRDVGERPMRIREPRRFGLGDETLFVQVREEQLLREVGYYLLADGIAPIEAEIHARPPLRRRFVRAVRRHAPDAGAAS